MQHQQQESYEPPPHPDTILFGSIPSELTDEFCERIDAALVEGVSSLPLLPKQSDGDDETGNSSLSGEALFLKRLRETYMDNVDTLERYILHNIFTIQNYPKHQRDKIFKCMVRPMTTKTSNHDDTASHHHDPVEAAKALVRASNDKDDINNKPLPTPTSEPTRPPSPVVVGLQDIPSSSDMEDLQRQVLDLRAQLRKARSHRRDVQAQLRRLHRVDQSVKGATQVLQSTNEDDSTTTTINTTAATMHQSITAMILGKQGLEQLQTVGQGLKQHLDDEKQQYNDKEDDEENVPYNKRPKLSVEEQYQQQRRQIHTSTEGLHQMTKLLKDK